MIKIGGILYLLFQPGCCSILPLTSLSKVHIMGSISVDSKLKPDEIIQQSVWTFQRLFSGTNRHNEDEEKSEVFTVISTRRYNPLLVPIIRKFAVLHQPHSWLTVGVSLGLGYYVLTAKKAEAKDSNLYKQKVLKQSQLPMHEVVGRVVLFWRKVAPIIVHYKFTCFWVNTVKSYDRNRRDEIYDTLHERYALQAKSVICQMKGLFIKVGQVLSSRGDFMPGIYIEHFSELQDNVPVHPADDIKATLSESIYNNHGLMFEQVFESFDDKPLGSASIGSVHAATLTDEFLKRNESYLGGKEVAVKVMHADAENRFKNDFKILKWLCRVALPGWSPILPELEKQFMTEFDYLNEAASLEAVRQNMLSSPYKHRVRVPEPLIKYCTKNVLIMEKLEGDKLVSVAENKLTKVLKGDKDLAKKFIDDRRKAMMRGAIEQTHGEKIKMMKQYISHFSIFDQLTILCQLASLILTQRRNVDLLLDVHGYQIFVNGQFNGDPHPGNILILKSGQLGLIDYGQCYKLKEFDRLAISSIVSELGSDVINTSMVSLAMRNMGFRFKHHNDNCVTEMAKLLFDSDHARIKLGLPSPQELLNYLNAQDQMVHVPDAAVFICRTSFLFRGIGSMIGMNIQTAPRWRHHALTALEADRATSLGKY